MSHRVKDKDYFKLIHLHKKIKKRYKYCFILSPKGIGKTYSAIKLVFWNWEKKGKSSAYFFRHMSELEHFIPELKSYTNQNYIIKKKGYTFHLLEKETLEIVCLFFGLNQAQYIKNYQNVNLIIFDEFLDVKGLYIKNEFKIFALLLSNLTRTKQKFNFYALGNYHEANNPYFNRLKIYQWKPDKYGILTDGTIAYMEIVGEEYLKVINAQGANALLNYDTSLMEKYRLGGFNVDDLRYIQINNVEVFRCIYRLRYKNVTFYLWETTNRELYFTGREPRMPVRDMPLSFLDTLETNKSNKIERLVNKWKKMLYNNRIIFETFEYKDLIYDFLNRNNSTFDYE